MVSDDSSSSAVRDGDAVGAAFAAQAAYCRDHGSPFTARLLDRATVALAEGDPVLAAIAAWRGDPKADALPLRFAAAVHALASDCGEAELSRVYPHGDAIGADRTRFWQVVREALGRHPRVLADYLASPPQTNEVGRSAVLAAGFAVIAARWRPPLRLLELGASAGLNLFADRYRCRLGTLSLGPQDSALQLAPRWQGGDPPRAAVDVAVRAGCDRAPVMLADPAQRRRLRAYVWADQDQRLARLDAAIGIARSHPVTIEPADAVDWLEARLREHAQGMATVVFHSIVWAYLGAERQARLRDVVQRAGVAATAESPLAWLRFEHDALDRHPQLRLHLWPGDAEFHLAEAHAHGEAVHWFGTSAIGPSSTMAFCGGQA